MWAILQHCLGLSEETLKAVCSFYIWCLLSMPGEAKIHMQENAKKYVMAGVTKLESHSLNPTGSTVHNAH